MDTQLYEDLGLSLNEARIYDALVTYGGSGVSTIALRSNVHRSNAYDSLHRLIEKGLVYEVFGQRETLYEAVDPGKLLDYEEYLPFETVRTLAKPTIACIDGLCIGGGLTLALMCDCLIATDRSRFGIPEAKVGIVDGHLPRLLRQAVPPARLRYWMYTGALFPAHEAYEAGLLSKVVPADQLEETLEKMLKDLKASSPEAIRHLKVILNETRPLSAMTDAYLTMLQPHVKARLEAFSSR